MFPMHSEMLRDALISTDLCEFGDDMVEPRTIVVGFSLQAIELPI
jgi:hypothetical protein